MLTPQQLLLFHLCSTWAMVGVIWFVQIIHYPLFSSVPHEGFPEYERRNCNLTSFVVLPFMLVELVTAVLLLLSPPANLMPIQIALGAALLFVIWISTFLLQVPQHNSLTNTFDTVAHKKLVATNWIRTAAWTLRGVLAASWMVT